MFVKCSVSISGNSTESTGDGPHEMAVANVMITSHLDYCDSLFYLKAKAKINKSIGFRIPYVTLCVD